MSKHELPSKLFKQIKILCKEGDSLHSRQQDSEALDKYHQAWNLLPEDKIEWEAATWILSSIGDIYFCHQKLDRAFSAFNTALSCPGGLGNPYIHLRLGEILYDMDDRDASSNHLMRAYMGAGEEIFADADPKYLEFLKTLMEPPVQ